MQLQFTDQSIFKGKFHLLILKINSNFSSNGFLCALKLTFLGVYAGTLPQLLAIVHGHSFDARHSLMQPCVGVHQQRFYIFGDHGWVRTAHFLTSNKTKNHLDSNCKLICKNWKLSCCFNFLAFP